MPWYFRQYLPQLRAAVDRAPSIVNQRPWELELATDERVELYSVPNDTLAQAGLLRETVISCGAALYNLRLAIRVAGRQPTVWLLPHLDAGSGLLDAVTGERTLLASIEVAPGRPARPTDAQQELYEALWLRRTEGGPYRYLPVPPPILVEMEIAAAHEHGWLRTLPPAEAKRAMRAASRAGGELGHRMSPLGAMPGTAERFERHPVLMALSTDDDRPLDWLRAGQALQHALLAGTRFSMSAPGGRSTPYRQQLEYGPLDPHRLRPRPPVPAGYAVEASFLTQTLELADVRHRVRSWPWQTSYTEVPQVLLRVGYAPVERGSGPEEPDTVPVPRPVGG